MFGFILQKMRNKKWMILSLLIGNILIVAIASASSMYSSAVLQRTLTRYLSDYQKDTNKSPGGIFINSVFSGLTTQQNMDKTESYLKELLEELQVPVEEYVESYHRQKNGAYPIQTADDEKSKITVTVSAYEGFEEHVEMIFGSIYEKQDEIEAVEAIVNEKTYVEKNLMIGDVFVLPHMKDGSGNPCRIKISGVYKAENEDLYFKESPEYKSDELIILFEEFEERFVRNEKPASNHEREWYAVLDYTSIRAEDTQRILSVLDEYEKLFKTTKISKSEFHFKETMEAFLPVSEKLGTTVMILQVPVFVLLIAFIFMVSRQMLEMEQNEIAVFKSRGASKKQILLLYLLQSLLIGIVSVFAGLGSGVMICRIIGSANAFLEFVNRSALQIRLDMKVWAFALGAALIAVGTMVLPVFKFAGVTIVDHKRQTNRKGKRPLWQTVCLDLILIAVSVYGLYQFRQQEAYLSAMAESGASLDPFLYISSSLFMVGCGLLVLRILPVMIRVVFKTGEKYWSPGFYASFLRIIRSSQNQGFLVVFLVLTVALGIFNTRMARTINANGEEKIYYSTGADLVLQEQWGSNADQVEADSSGATQLTYTEPDFYKYEQMEGIRKATKVLVDGKGQANVNEGSVSRLTVMGIHTKEFGEVAWFKESLLPVHWYEYLNAMSQNADSVLVSSNFRDEFGYQTGDLITYCGENERYTRGIIVGFVDYWPSYSPVTRVKDVDGIYKEKENYLIVAHLSKLQSVWGITPYQVWVDAEDSTEFIYDYAQENDILFQVFRDSTSELVDLKNDPVFQGTNGVLTIGFIVVLLLCAVGFLIYWILSIQSRTLQFGIFRAMGMSAGEVLGMLVHEQVFISGTSILGGVVVGQLVSELFVPMIQMAYSSADRVIPLEIISNTGDYLRLGIVIGLMIIVCMIVLSVLISKIRITQALKLGED